MGGAGVVRADSGGEKGGGVMRADGAANAAAALSEDPGVAGAMPPVPATDGSSYSLIQAVPTVDPSDPALSDTVDRLRSDLPSSALVGGAAVENLDLKTQLDDSTPLVIGVILALGFLLLLVALQAPLIALLGTLASLLSTAAAFGVARLEPQGPLAKQTGFRTKALARAHSRPDRRLAAYAG